MNRRNFLKASVLGGFAPAVVGSGVLMPVKEIALPEKVAFSGLVETDLAVYDLINKKITPRRNYTPSELYTDAKNVWFENENAGRHKMPIKAYTREHFALPDEWNMSDSSIQKWEGGGCLDCQDSSGNVTARYQSVVTLGVERSYYGGYSQQSLVMLD